MSRLTYQAGEHCWDQELIIVKNLTVICLLRTDFLIQHGAIVDCKSGQLSLAHVNLPIDMGSTYKCQMLT